MTYRARGVLIAAEALQNIDKPEALELVANAVVADNARQAIHDGDGAPGNNSDSEEIPAYLKMMNVIENVW